MGMAGDEAASVAGGAPAWLRRRRRDRPAWPEPAGWLARQLAVEEGARSGFFLAPLGIIAGIVLFYGADLRPGYFPSILLGAALAALWAMLRARPVAGSLACAGFFAVAGIGLAEVELARTQTTIFSGEATVRIEGRVVWRDVDDRGRYRYVIDVVSTERPVLSRPPERVRIVVSSRHEPIPAGGTYSGLVRLRPPSGPAFPGSYDFAFVPYFQGLGAYGFSLGAPEPPSGLNPENLTFAEKVATVRIQMAQRIRDVVPDAEGAVASALITGERAGIPYEVDEWLRITGLAHVLSISGFHMALIAGFTMLSVRAIASAVPGLPLLVSTKKIAAVAAFLVSTAYLLIAGDNVATQRSYIMLVIMLGAVLIDRPALTLRNVAIAGLIVMTLSPHAVLTANFQMSFAATAALVGAYASLMRWWNREGGLPPLRERGLVAVFLLSIAAAALSSILAGGATTPYGAYHFQRAAPFGGLIANVLAMPLFSFWIMPLALVAVLVMPLGLDGPLLVLMGYGLTVVFRMAEQLSIWFPDHGTGLMTQAGLIVLTAAVLAVCFFSSRLRWAAVPMAIVGLLVAPNRAPAPELLVFEDGKQMALIDEDGQLVHLRERPNRFVDTQWQRAFPQQAPSAATASVAQASSLGVAALDDAEALMVMPKASDGFTCEDEVCRAVTRSGLTVAWTEDYTKTGLLCESADVAIVSRAIRLAECRSGAYLVTLRTLRRTGSLAVSRDPLSGEPAVTASIGEHPREWNVHRHADWPEYWRNPERGEPQQPAASSQ